MNGYLFDTDALSQPLRKRPAAGFVERVTEVPQEQQFTSSVTVAEMMYGAHRLPQPQRMVDRVVQVLSAVRVLPFDQDAALVAGQLRARLERRGRSVAAHDLIIASIAVTADLVLVTGNLRHFEGIPGLRVENWLRPD